MSLNNSNFHSNKMKDFMVAKSQSHIFLNNLALTNNHGNGSIRKNISLQYLIKKFCKNVKIMITKSNVSSTVYHISGNSAIQLNNVAFIRNKLLDKFLRIKSHSTAMIQNNTLTENNISSTLGVALLNYLIIGWLGIALSTCIFHIHLILKLMQSLLKTTHFLS